MARKRVKRVEIWHSKERATTQVAFIRTDGEDTYYGVPRVPSDKVGDLLDNLLEFGDSQIILGRSIYTYPDRLSVTYRIDLEKAEKERRRWLENV